MNKERMKEILTGAWCKFHNGMLSDVDIEEGNELIKEIVNHPEIEAMLESELEPESCDNCHVKQDCRHKAMMPQGQKTCNFYRIEGATK